MDGAVILRGLGRFSSNFLCAAAELHVHQRHIGMSVLEKPHCAQTKRGLFGQRCNEGSESDAGRCWRASAIHDE